MPPDNAERPLGDESERGAHKTQSPASDNASVPKPRKLPAAWICCRHGLVDVAAYITVAILTDTAVVAGPISVAVLPPDVEPSPTVAAMCHVWRFATPAGVCVVMEPRTETVEMLFGGAR
jgi:hypothetical protein